jgi:hypothetical protein
MFNLKMKNQYRKVSITNIVALQGYDYNEMCKELDSDYDESGSIAAWLNDKDVIDYLLQWYQDSDNCYQVSNYDAYHLNSNFLGKVVKVNGYKGYFLYNHNSKMGYASLGRLVEVDAGI